MSRFLIGILFLLAGTFHAFAQPANDNCAGATVLTVQTGSCTTTTTGTTAGATQSTQSAFIPFATDDDVWYKFTTPAGAPDARFNLILRLSDVVYPVEARDIYLERREASSGICNDFYTDFETIMSGATEKDWLMTGLLPATEYSIRLYTDGIAAPVNFKICLFIPPPPANDQCDAATRLIPQLNTCTPAGPFNTMYATKSPQTAGDFSGSDDDVWFYFTTPAETRKYIAELSSVQFNPGFGNTVIELWATCGSASNLVYKAFALQADLGVLTPSTTYRVRVYSFGTSSRLKSFHICIKMVLPPANDECSSAADLVVGPEGVFAPAIQGTTRYASQSAQPEAPCFTLPDDDVWYRFTAPATGVVELKMDNITNPDGFGTPIMAAMLYAGACNSLENKACLSSNTGIFSGLTPGQVYILRVMTNDGEVAANFDIALRALVVPPNDDCLNAQNVPVNTDGTYNQFVRGTTLLANTSSIPLTPCVPQASNDVWYRFTAPAGGSVQMQLFNIANPQGGSTGMYTILYNGNCVTPVHMQCSNFNMTVFTGLTEGFEYLVRVMSNSPGQSVVFSLGMRALLPLQDNGSCANVRTLTTTPQRGTTLGLTMSNTTVACYGGVAPNKVLYYQFVATATSHYIDFGRFINLSLNANGMGFRVYKTPCTGDLVAQSVKCISSVAFANDLITGLTIGDTYYVQVMENTFNGGPMEFDIRLAPQGTAIWKGGGGDNKFSNPANWMNNQVPGENSDVIIPGGKPTATVSESIAIRSLKLDPGARLETAPGVVLNVRE